MNFIILIIIPMLLGLWAQMKVHGTYNRWSKVYSKNGLSGKDAAEAILHSAGIRDVSVISVPGHLSDHYDPSKKQLALSTANYKGTSLAALGVAAHEAGHALQDKAHYAPLKARAALIPVTNFACVLLPFVILGGFIFPFLGAKAILMAIIAYLVLTVFQLVTLPVEFDASKRAKQCLLDLGIVAKEEMKGVSQTLDAAAFTYVAAFIASLGTLLHYIHIYTSNRD